MNSKVNSIKPLSLDELKATLAADKNTILLDVRSYEEREVYHIGGVFIPLPELSSRLNELDLAKPVIAYCRSGKRSLVAANILREAGCADVSYLAELLI